MSFLYENKILIILDFLKETKTFRFHDVNR
nr:MAG TPA: hypothetical protein [Caudoviricetes sp.]